MPYFTCIGLSMFKWHGKMNGKKTSPGRLQKISQREKWIIHRNVQQLRNTEGSFTVNRLQEECGFQTVPLCKMNRTLKRMNYQFCDTRRKGLLTKRDNMLCEVCKWCFKQILSTTMDKWHCSSLDSASFWYKSNPVVGAKKHEEKYGKSATRD